MPVKINFFFFCFYIFLIEMTIKKNNSNYFNQTLTLQI